MFSITCNGGRCRVLTTLQLDGQNSLMPHFHVVALRYRLQPGDHVSYPDPPPLVFENEVARFGLEKNQLRCEMKSHVATLDEARALIDPILRNWRRNATKTFGIDEGVLQKLARLASTRGDHSDARKMHPSAQPLTGDERAWIEATIKHLVLRLCDPPPNYKRPTLTMADLPP